MFSFPLACSGKINKNFVPYHLLCIVYYDSFNQCINTSTLSRQLLYVKKLAKTILYFSTMMLIGGEKIRYKKHLKVSIITLRNVKSYTYESNG